MASATVQSPSRDVMDQAFQELTRYARRTHIWLSQCAFNPTSIGCNSLLLYGSSSPSAIIQPIVSPVLPEEKSSVPFGTFAMISYEIENIGLFREPVTTGCLTKIIKLFIHMRDEVLMMDDTEMLPRADDAVKAIRQLRKLFCEPDTYVPDATEALCEEAPRAFAYALSVVRQAVTHNARSEIMGLYNHADLEEMYRFGIEAIGELVSDPEMVYGAEYAAPVLSAERKDISHNILKWVAFLCEEVLAVSSSV